MTFEEFKALYDDISSEEEYEFFFSDTDKTYMIIKYDDHVSFQRCGASEGSGKYNYNSLMELYQTESVDGIHDKYCIDIYKPEHEKAVVAILIILQHMIKDREDAASTSGSAGSSN